MRDDAPEREEPVKDDLGRGLGRLLKWIRNRLRVLWRWLWLTVVVVGATGAVLAYWLSTTAPEYEATAKIGLPTLSERGVMSFIEVLKSGPVRQQTTDELGLKGKVAAYDLDVRNLGGAGFVELTVVTQNANLAAQIANTHTEKAIAYFDVLRAEPAGEELRVLEEQLSEAQADLYAAEQAFADFRTENEIGSLHDRLVQYERTLGTLRTDRDRQLAAGQQVTAIENVIAQREQQLSRLTELAPTYNALEDAVSQKQKVFNQFHNKYIAAELALTDAQATDDVEVVESAKAPKQPVSVPQKLFAMGLAAAVGIGIGLAFVMESVFPARSSREEQKA